MPPQGRTQRLRGLTASRCCCSVVVSFAELARFSFRDELKVSDDTTGRPASCWRCCIGRTLRPPRGGCVRTKSLASGNRSVAAWLRWCTTCAPPAACSAWVELIGSWKLEAGILEMGNETLFHFSSLHRALCFYNQRVQRIQSFTRPCCALPRPRPRRSCPRSRASCPQRHSSACPRP